MRVKKWHVILFIFLFLWVATGPFAIILVTSGKKYRNLLKKKTTKTLVQKQLGIPFWRVEYKTPIPIVNTDEYKGAKQRNGGYDPSVWGINDNRDNVGQIVVGSCEIYRNIGPYSEINRGDAYGMIVALTLGMGGPIALWMAIPDWLQLQKKEVFLTFWFDKDNKIVAYHNGNILTYEE